MFNRECFRSLAFGCVLAASSTASVLAQAPAERRELDLKVGEQRVLPSEGVRSYSEGIEGIVDVRLTRDASQFVLVGMQPGRTTLLFIMNNGSEKHYHITVGSPQESPLLSEGDSESLLKRDNVRLDFYFVQLNRSDHSKLGVAWPGSIGGAGLNASFDFKTGALQSANASLMGQVLPRLDLAEASGWAKVMKHAAVVTANRSEGTYSGGGEINLPIQGALTADVEQIRFGSTIKVVPRYDRDLGRIELQIEADISELSSDEGTGIPGRLTSNLSTVVNMELGQALVLAGLRAHHESKSRDGLPFLSRIPILGALFGSRASRTQQVENLIVVIPTVVEAVPPRARRLVHEALESFRRFAGDLEQPQLPTDHKRSRIRGTGK